MQRWLFTAGLVVAAAVLGAAGFGIRWNLSTSVEPGLYRASGRSPARGDLVTVCLPRSVGRWAVGRGYVTRGRCPGGAALVGKWIVGAEGDRVEVADDAIRIDDRRLERSERVDVDADGRPVPRVLEGAYVLAAGEVWLHSGLQGRSLDSRVFGPLEMSSIQTVIDPVWVAGSRFAVDGR